MSSDKTAQHEQPALKKGFASRLASTANQAWKNLRKKVLGSINLLRIAGQMAKEDSEDFKKENIDAVEDAISGESGVQLMVETKRDLKEINWQKQGNADFYSDAAIRGRHMLRTDPNIIREIQKWWKWIPKENMGTTSVHIVKPVYEAIVVVIQLVLLPVFGMKGDMNYDPEEDWLDDNKGLDIMAYPNFFDAMFELADMWCESVSAFKYAEILARLLHDVMNNERILRKMFKKFGYEVPPWWPGDPPPPPALPPPPAEKKEKKKLRKPSPPPPFIRPFVPKPEVPKVKRRPVSARPLNWKPPITCALYEAGVSSSSSPPVYSRFPTSIEVVGSEPGCDLTQPFFLSPRYPSVAHGVATADEANRVSIRPMDRRGTEAIADHPTTSASNSPKTGLHKSRPRTAHSRLIPTSSHQRPEISLASFIAPAPSAFSRAPAWFSDYMAKTIAKHKAQGGIPVSMNTQRGLGEDLSPRRTTSPTYGRERARRRSASPPTSPFCGGPKEVSRANASEGGLMHQRDSTTEWTPLQPVLLLPPTDLPDMTSPENRALLVLQQRTNSPPREMHSPRGHSAISSRQRPMTARIVSTPQASTSPGHFPTIPEGEREVSSHQSSSSLVYVSAENLKNSSASVVWASSQLDLTLMRSPRLLLDPTGKKQQVEHQEALESVASKEDRSSRAFRERFGPPPSPPAPKPRPSSARTASLNETDLNRLNQLAQLRKLTETLLNR